MISGALEGFTCIDVSGHVAGPYAGSLLGDLGCEVIKVELPNGGDSHRVKNGGLPHVVRANEYTGVTELGIKSLDRSEILYSQRCILIALS
jgi:crotonobetainyl-CoA:carnitine CoA-transferase CaiB-like acyl-CoA transferase